MFLVPCPQDSISTLSGSFLAIFFCCAVTSCAYDHNHPYLVFERLFLAENKAFPYPRRAGAHPRRAGAILWDAAATSPVVVFVAVAPKQRSQKMSVSWSTLGLVDWLPVSAGNFGRALQRHFSVDFQNQDVVEKIFSCSKKACFALVNRARNGRTASAQSLPTRRFRNWSKTEATLQRQRHCSVTFQSIFKTKMSLERSFPALNELVCFCESSEKRPNSVCSEFADASVSRLIEDWGRSTVQASYRLSKVQETRAALETLTWRTYETKCKSWNDFLFYFQRGKAKENSKRFTCCLKNHTQYLYTVVSYDTPKPR